METAKLVFWQGGLSIHQAPLIRAVQDVSSAEVTVVVERASVGGRAQQGWKNPDYGAAEIIECQTPRDAVSVAASIGVGAVNVVSGLDSNVTLRNASTFLARVGAVVLYQTERWDARGLRGVLRYFKYLRRSHNVNDFDRTAVLAMGSSGVRAFKSAGVLPSKLYEFGYFTSVPTPTENARREGAVFVGTLDANKNVKAVVAAFLNSLAESRLTVVGDGPLRSELEQAAHDDPRINFTGVLDNDEIGKTISEHQMLVLPSRHDGWGAVVNESLLVGTPVVCSQTVGAECLVSGPGPDRGLILERSDRASVRGAVDLLTGNYDERINNGEIRSWAVASLAPEVGANYLLDIADSKTSAAGIEKLAPPPPWRRARL